MVGKLSSAWTQHLPPEKQKDFADLVRNSTQLLTRLKQIIEDHERQLHNTSLSIKDFSDPNWSTRQAFKLGSLSALKDLKEIIPF